MLTGYRAAIAEEVEIIVKIDGDGQMDPAYLLSMIAPILAGGAVYTKGDRFLHSLQLKTMPINRQIGNIGLSFLITLNHELVERHVDPAGSAVPGAYDQAGAAGGVGGIVHLHQRHTV